jgi:hypothetical protein
MSKSKITVEGQGAHESNIDRAINLLNTFAKVNDIALFFGVIDASGKLNDNVAIRAGFTNMPMNRGAIVGLEYHLGEAMALLKKQFNEVNPPL